MHKLISVLIFVRMCVLLLVSNLKYKLYIPGKYIISTKKQLLSMQLEHIFYRAGVNVSIQITSNTYL